MAQLFRDLPEALTNTLRDRRDVLGLQARSSASRCCRSFPVPEGYDEPTLLPPRRARGPRARASPSSTRSGKTVDRRRRTATRLEMRARRHRADEVPGLLPDRLGLHPLRRRRTASRSGPGRGSGAGSIVAYALRHHRPRSDPVQPAVRALPEPRAREHARLRRRLLHGPARRGHRLRRRRSTARRASGRSRPSTSSRRAA